MTYATARLGLVVALSVALIVPAVAHAGVVQYVTSLLQSEEAAAAPVTAARAPAVSIQSMPLLSPVSGPAADDARQGGGNISVVGSAALQAEAGPAGGPEDRSVTPESDQINVYVVRKGDSLSQIAEMFDVTVNTIKWANDISRDDLIQTGQRLVILPVSGVRHTVEEGDTLKSIAEEYDGKVRKIAQFNDLANDATLTPGEEVIIPNGEVEQQTPHTQQHYAQKAGGSSAATSGYFIRPVRNGVMTQYLHGYNAIDFGAQRGTPVVAAADGQVIIQRSGGWNGGYGNYVVIRHDNGTQTLYSHQSRNIVSVGQQVVQGQAIGYVGSTGRSTGPHVHFEVRGGRNPFR